MCGYVGICGYIGYISIVHKSTVPKYISTRTLNVKVGVWHISDVQRSYPHVQRSHPTTPRHVEVIKNTATGAGAIVFQA